jgi:hypothetical protein
MSRFRASLSVVEPDDEIRAYLGGTDASIPVIEFGPTYPNIFEIAVHIEPPAEQAAWLRRLAVAVEELAEQAEQAEDQAQVPS